MSEQIYQSDCLEWMRTQEDDSVDLTVCSPPYEDARTYGIDFRLRGQEWVDWAVERFAECYRITKGLVVWVVEGKTRNFRYSATPLLLMADLHRAGIKLRKPPVFHRVGIPGSGGPDWWRNDYEFCICASKGKLPWSDNTANGHPPKWAPGGEMSYRLSDGTRHVIKAVGTATRGSKNGDLQTMKQYSPPKLANAGNVIKCNVGRGHMGSMLAHENEAPFPESLVEHFVKCFCPPEGTVFDPFCGSGTSLAVAKRLGRQFVGCDIREDQVDLSRRRLSETEPAA